MAFADLMVKPVEKKVGGKTVKLIWDDLTALPVDAFVFYAREDLDIGTGYGTAIQMRAGLSVKKELEQIGGVKMGEAVVTAAGDMKAKHIIHACGPKFLEKDLEGKLRTCMGSTLKAASDKGIKTLAMPPMGTGFYGVPMPMAVKVMLETVKGALQGSTSLEEVIICTNDKRDFDAFKEKVENL